MKLWCALCVVFWGVFCSDTVAAVSSVLVTENVALGKTCNMTSSYNEDGFNNNCVTAINGNTSTAYDAGNCIHTDIGDSHPRWNVDLGHYYNITSIVIYARLIQLARMAGVSVYIDNSKVYEFVTQPTATITIPISPAVSGRVVSVNKNRAIINICEVQVLAQRFVENVAVNKPCNMSKAYYYEGYNGYDVFNNSCSAANNDDTSTINALGNCIRTDWDVRTPQWTVNLGQVYTVYKITIFPTRGAESEMTDVKVQVGDNPAQPVPSTTNTNPLGVVLSPPQTGSTVTVFRQDLHGRQYNYLRFCEVQVWRTCEPGLYGNSCDQTCQYNDGCQSHTCSPLDGHCVCRDGWKTPLCIECAPGRYEKSSDCQKRCGAGCTGGICSDDGTCSCRPGWQTPSCVRCDADHYNQSADCVHQCGAGCVGCHDNGTCKACKPHFAQMPSCDHCDNLHYGSDCSSVCGHCAGQGGCGRNDGHCPGDCEAGWKPFTCVDPCDTGTYGVNCRQSCSKGCEHGACDAAAGTCTCRTNWGPKTPQPSLCNECLPGHYNTSGNCTHDCGHCAGNAVCDKVTGLCSACQPGRVMPLCQQECEDGRYGQDCNGTCGHCDGGQPCNKANGQCQACAAGYQPSVCKLPCADGHYGKNCEGECGHCANKAACDRFDGTCPLLSGSTSRCESSFYPPFCQANDGADSQSKSGDSGNLVGPIVGAILGAGVIIAIALIASQCWMKRRRTNSNSGVQSPGTQEQQRDKNTVAMDPIPSAAETGSLAAPTTSRRLPASPPEDVPRVQSEVYEVIRENNYDSLHPYVNDFNPDRDVYTHIQDQ